MYTADYKIQALRKLKFCKTCFHHYGLKSFPCQTGFSDKKGDINKCDFLTMTDEMCKHLEDLYNPRNKYFPHD